MSVAFYVMVIGAVSWLIFILLIIGIVAYMSTSNEEENGWILNEPLWHKEFQYQTTMFANPNDAAEKT